MGFATPFISSRSLLSCCSVPATQAGKQAGRRHMTAAKAAGTHSDPFLSLF